MTELGQSSEVVVLRPTASQRVASAAAKALCALPLLTGAVLGDGMVPTALVATLIAGVVVFGLDLAVRRHQQVELRVDGLVARGRTYPWWAIDAVIPRRRAGRDVVELRAFGLEGFDLDAPRSSPLGRNPSFAAELELLLGAWEKLGRPGPTEIDLRNPPVTDGGTGFDPRPGNTSARRGDR